MSLCGADGQINDKYSFSYKENYTVITDSTGQKYTYRFNNFGQTTSVVDNQTNRASYYEFGAPSAGNGSEKANKVLSESNVQNAVTNYMRNSSFTNGGDYYRISIASMLNSTVFVSFHMDKTAGKAGRPFRSESPVLPIRMHSIFRMLRRLPGFIPTLRISK